VTSGSFQTTSPDWELQKLSWQVTEAVERFLGSLFGENSPIPEDWVLPEWWLQGIFWLVLLSLLGWGGWQLYRLLSPYFIRSSVVPGPGATPLAAAPELTAGKWLERSRLAQRQGNYREACRALYMASLHHLHANDLIRHQPSRTDGEYLQLLQTLQTLQTLPNPLPYQLLIHTHERLCFSPTDVSAAEFEQCQQAYREIAPS
jgi:Domain of unknown function (DUF4129)